jgi:transcriptional regulator with XRE-family HTH domain
MQEPLPIGTIVRRAREARNFTRNELARLTDLDPSHLYRIEIGERQPRRGTVKALERALNVNLSDNEYSFFSPPDGSTARHAVTGGDAAGKTIRMALPHEIDFRGLQEPFHNLLLESSRGPKFRETGAVVRLEHNRLNVGETMFGEENCISLPFDQVQDIGTVHVHPLCPDGQPMPPSESDIETAYKEDEKLAFVLSGATVFALIRQCHRNAVVVDSVRDIYAQAFMEAVLRSHVQPQQIISRALMAAAAAAAQRFGYLLYSGPLRQNRLTRVIES